MAGEKKSPVRAILTVLVVIACAFGAYTLLTGGSDKPAGVPDDASVLEYVAKSGDDGYEMGTIDGGYYVLSADNLEVFRVEDSHRDFLSRNKDILYLQRDTADKLGLTWDDLTPVDGE